MYLDRESKDSNHVYMCLPAAKHQEKKPRICGFPISHPCNSCTFFFTCYIAYINALLFMKKFGATTPMWRVVLGGSVSELWHKLCTRIALLFTSSFVLLLRCRGQTKITDFFGSGTTHMH